MSGSNIKAAPDALNGDAVGSLINWMDRRADVDRDAFHKGDFLQHYWKDKSQRQIMAEMLDEVVRLRRVVVDLESDFAEMRAGRALYKRGVTVADIIQAAAMTCKVLACSVRSYDSDYRVVAARQTAVFVARTVFRFSNDQIAAQLWRHDLADIQRMFDLAEVRRSQLSEQIELTINALRGVHG